MGGERPPSAVATRLPRRRRPLILTLLLPTSALSFSIKHTLPFPSSLLRPTGYNRATTDVPCRSQPSSSSRVVLYSSPLARLNLPNPLARGQDSSDASSSSEDTLFAKAKAFLSSDLGINDDGAAISDDSIWIGANLGGGKVLNKKDYLAAGKFFDLRSTFPDLDYRAHDFRVDGDDPNTVRLTARTVGTMRGELRLRTETLPPNGRRMVCPPEAISVTFDPTTGLVTKLCSGFCLDRLVGNTRGLCGVKAAAVVAGAPPSEWETYPPTTVVSRFFGRSVKQLPDDPGAFLAPFPETVMVQLAKGVIAADNGSADPELLAPSFTFCGPFVGPIDKDGFVKAFGSFKLKEAFPDLDPSYTNFRVDPYDPYRVWVDARASGTRTGSLAGSQPTGLRYEGPPEAASFTFDDDGFCTRLTGGYVLDPSVGNTGGLGGVYGIFYATGTPLPGISSRPLPELLTRLQKRILEPITGVGVDEYKLPKTPLADVMGEKESSGTTTTPSVKPSPPIKPPSIPVPPSIKGIVEPPKVKPPPPMKTKAIAPPPKPEAASQPSLAQRKDVNVDLGDPVTDAFKSLFGAEEKRGAAKATTPPSPVAKVTAGEDRRKKQLEEKKKAAEVAAEAKRKRDEDQRAAAEAKREQQRIEAERRKAAAEAQRAETERKRVAAEEQRVAAEAKREAQRVEEAERKRIAAQEQRVAEETRRQAQRQEAERKRAAAEEQRAAAEAKREEQRKAAEAKREAQRQEAERKKEVAEKQRAAAEAKREAQRQEAERRKAAAEERRVAAERQREEAQRKKEAAEEARKQAITKRAKAEQAARDAKVRKATEAKAAAERTKKMKADATAKKAAAEAAKKVKEAKPGATINLFDAFGKSAPEPATSRPSTPSTIKPSSRKKAAAAAKKVMKESKPGATINLFGAFGKSASGDESPTTKPKPKVTPKKDAAAAAEKAVKQAKPGATISLFSAFLKSPEGEKGDVAETKGTMFAAKKPALRGPKGIPVLTKWRKMRDGSVTGNIFGSSSFEEGEQVTTSAIVRGEFAAGNVVQTQSGSRYFLGDQ